MASKQTKTYLTGYIAFDYSDYPAPPYKGKSWQAELVHTDKCKQHRISYNSQEDVQCKEVFIFARSFRTAQIALNLINAAMVLCSGEAPLAERNLVEPTDAMELEGLFPKLPTTQFERTISAGGIPLACMVAAKSSHRRKYKYALLKHYYSYRMHSNPVVDIDPGMATQHLGVSPCPSDHVQMAYSIILAYSVIEELGLEIRASYRQPSTIDGAWNPKVKEDLEQRLKKAGINLHETIPWMLRGKPTKIEKSREVPETNKCEWSKGPYVRDRELGIADSIRMASYLRSKVAAHKIRDITSSLNSYDVGNVQHLAGRLLLDSLGFGNQA